MNKAELIAAVSEKAGLSKKDAGNAVSAFIDAIVGAVAADDKVQLVGFGTFETRQRAERTGRNPRTGGELKVPASKAPAFKAGKQFKDTVAGQ